MPKPREMIRVKITSTEKADAKWGDRAWYKVGEIYEAVDSTSWGTEQWHVPSREESGEGDLIWKADAVALPVIRKPKGVNVMEVL